MEASELRDGKHAVTVGFESYKVRAV